MPYNQDIIKVPRFEEANGFYTTAKRSKMMSKVRATDTKPEIAFRKALWAAGVRYRKNPKGMPGKPDIVIKKYRLAVFIDGEFWHGYNWPEKKKQIKSNVGFWVPKIERNMQRDEEVNGKMRELGYRVFRFWDFEVGKDGAKCLRTVLEYLAAYREGETKIPGLI